MLFNVRGDDLAASTPKLLKKKCNCDRNSARSEKTGLDIFFFFFCAAKKLPFDITFYSDNAELMGVEDDAALGVVKQAGFKLSYFQVGGC